MRVPAIYDVLKETFNDFSQDKVPRLGAALAYYSIFSLAPLLIIAIGIASVIFGPKAARGEIVGQIEDMIGPSAAQAIQDMLQAANQGGGGIIATVIGLVVLIFGASGVFVQLQDALNTIWHVTPKPDRSWLAMIRERFLSFAIVLGAGFLLLVLLVVSAALSAVNEFVTPTSLPGGTFLWQALNTVLSIGFITLLLSLLYKVLPDVKLGWRHVWVSALTSAVLFTVGKFLIGLYLAHSSTASAFGAAGSLVLLLVWVYYSSQIVLFGAQLSRTLLKRAGLQPEPADNAILVADETMCRQGTPNRDRLNAGACRAPERAAR
jgi:membrane protein